MTLDPSLILTGESRQEETMETLTRVDTMGDPSDSPTAAQNGVIRP